METSKLKQVLWPTRGQVLTCILASLAMFVLTYWSVLFSRSALADPYVGEVSSHQLARLTKIKAVDTIVKVIFWGSLGFMAYVVYLTITNALVETRNSVVIESSYTNKERLVDKLPTTFVRIATASTCLLWLFVGSKFLVPWWLEWFEKFLLVGASAWPAFVLATVGCAVTIYIAWTLVQLALLD